VCGVLHNLARLMKRFVSFLSLGYVQVFFRKLCAELLDTPRSKVYVK
jgi:hypothetical protein